MCGCSPTGWTAPTTGYPTGTQWISSYLAPLADVLGERVRFDARVVGVSRRGRDRLVDAGRAEQPFTVHVESADGEYRLDARAVIDASGTWSTPNPAGADGLPALGERAASETLSYQIPDFRNRARFEGKHTVIVGSGHSAVTALARIVRRNPDTTVTWVLRRGTVGNAFGGGDADEMPARGALGLKAKELVDGGLISLVTGFPVERVRRDGDQTVLVSEDGRELPGADRVIVLTGFRPDLSFLSELRINTVGSGPSSAEDDPSDFPYQISTCIMGSSPSCAADLTLATSTGGTALTGRRDAT